MTNKEIAEALSGADFEKVKDKLAENIEWNMYEESEFIQGKQAVIEFSEKVKEYFQSITTNFETTGVIEADDKIAIYGRAEFIRDGKIVNSVNSCDVYEFDADGKVSKVHSYCNSKRPS
jgi:ketosteroid isomerase-like protein